MRQPSLHSHSHSRHPKSVETLPTTCLRGSEIFAVSADARDKLVEHLMPYDPRMNLSETDPWFARYLDSFAACGRGERDPSTLLDYYGVPLLVTMGDRFLALTSAEEVTGMATQQIEGMPAADYDHSDVLDFEVTKLNAASRLCRGTFSRHTGDGTEINQLTATYFLTQSADATRISGIALHS